MGGRLDVELGRQVRVAGGGGRQLIEHVVVALRLGLVSDPRLLQEVILAEIHIKKNISNSWFLVLILTTMRRTRYLLLIG